MRVSQIAVSTKLTFARAAAKAKKAAKLAAQCAETSALALKKRRESEPPWLPPRRGNHLPRRYSASAALARPARMRDVPGIFTYKHHEPLLRPLLKKILILPFGGGGLLRQ